MTSMSRDEQFEKKEAFSDVIPAVTSELPEVQGTQDDVIPTVTQEHSEFEESTELPELTLEGLEQTNVISPEKDGSSHKYILLPCSVKVKVRVKCGGCGKEAEVDEDDASLDLAEASYICDICKSRAQKKLRLHQLINGGTFAQEPERAEPKRKHPCPHCNKEFNSQKDMKRHTNIHTGLRPYVCDTCGKAFSQSCSLKRHLVTHTDLKPHRCEVCGLTFKGHLARHMRSHTGEKPFTCEICQKGFYRSELLKRHLAEHMTDGTVSCSKTQLDDIFQRSLSKQHTCLICDKTYTNSGHLARHMKQHNNENVLRCGVCTKVFYVKEQLQEHLQGHSKEDLAAIIAGTLLPTMTNGSPPTSDIDEAPVKEEPVPEDSTPEDLPPQNIVPGSDMLEHACLEDRVTCGICGHACCCTNYIPLHMENHEDAMVQCRSCGMDFAPTGASNGSQICSLCKPQETGIGAEAETNYVPDDVQDDVQEDIKDDGPVEDGEKRHKCLECDKSYKFIKHLREHARIHGGGYRPYRCNTCGKSFTKRYHLNRHQLIHGRLLQRQQSQSRTLVGLKPKVGRPLKYIETKPKVGRPPQHIETKRKVGRPLKHTEMKVKVGRPRLTETKPIVPVKEYRYTKPKANAGGMPFVCSACGKGFPKRVPLKRHLLNHLHQGTIPKDHPQLDEMKVNSYVNANVGDAPSPQLQSCPICNKACKGLHLHRHMKVHTQEEIEKCKEASVGASPQAQPRPQPKPQQQQHHKMQQPEILSGPAQGEIDFQKDGSPMDDDYSDEENMEEGDGSLLNVNDGLFNLGGDEPEEVKEHECLDDKVTCGICGHSCCCANYITVHMETHNDESDMCGKCGKELGDLPATSVKGGRICSICASRSRKQLRLHQILHNRVIQQEPPSGGMKKRFECPHCPKSFTDRKYFREHLRIHTGEKRYHCTFCGMAFAHSRNFKRHIWRHTGEKPNWCNICNKGIAGHLARHMRSHSDEKSYVCNMCHKGFNRSEHLKRHLKTHLGTQEEFHCHICPKKYLRKEHLKRHVRSHGEEAGTRINELSPANPYRPPVNDQPYREHPCTYDVAVCGLCGDACCCANYIPFHMEVHGERAEDYIEGTNLKKDVAPRQDGAGERKVREHSCTYDAVTCGLCGEACCCANYIPLHMELHREKASDLAKDYILKSPNDGILTNPDKVIPQKEPEAPQSGQKQVKEHPCLQDRVNCGMCGEACCCTNYIPFHMEQHDGKAPDPVRQDDILKKALDASEIGERDVKPHPCMHDIVTCGICGEPCCCANYIPFHMELHSEVMDQEPGNQEEVMCVANPVGCTDQDIAYTKDAGPEVAEHLVDTEEAAVPPEDGVAAVAVAEPEAVQGQVMNNGHAVVEEHVEEFDWASVANFLQGTREPDPLPVPPLLASGSNMEPLNGSPIKEEPSGGHIGENQATDHVCLQAQVTCETCGDVLCCINNLIFHLDTHKVVSVRCELCQLDVNITKTVSVLKDGMKIYKCGTCVMGMTAMSPSPSRTPQVRVGTPSGSVDKSLPCPHCSRVLKSRKEYTRHVKIHADIKPYKCDLCDKEFTAMANLKRHLDAHSGVKPHECKICGQFFSGHMARHMRTHTGEKKYSCDICSKGFHRLEHLKRHLGQHVKDGSSPSNCKQLRELGITADTAQSSEASPSKPNWCNICQKTIPGRLARHMLTHSDVKPFQCTHCEKAFYRSEHLKRHLEVHARRGEFSGVQSRR